MADGDWRPWDKCCIYGCGKPAVMDRLEEVYGDGRRTWIGYCEGHRPDDD